MLVSAFIDPGEYRTNLWNQNQWTKQGSIAVGKGFLFLKIQLNKVLFIHPKLNEAASGQISNQFSHVKGILYVV